MSQIIIGKNLKGEMLFFCNDHQTAANNACKFAPCITEQVNSQSPWPFTAWHKPVYDSLISVVGNPQKTFDDAVNSLIFKL